MATYTITVTRTSRAYFEVEADNKKDALKKAKGYMDNTSNDELVFDDENEPDVEITDATKVKEKV